MVNTEIERMGHGHALTVSLHWRLNPGELINIKENKDAADALIAQLAADAQRTILTKLHNQLKKVTIT